MKFKEPKTLEEQIEYLKQDKHVVYNDISEDDAKDVLQKYGYINVITPFKYVFAKSGKNGVIKDPITNKHQYERDVDFNQYFNKYSDERKDYPTLFSKISAFETTFNAVVSNCIVNYYHIDSEDKFDDFILDLKTNLLADKVIPQSAKLHMQNEINSFKSRLYEFGSVYICLDRMSLNSIITIYKTCDRSLKKQIFDILKKINFTFGYTDIPTFDEFLTRLVPIRNYVYHNNSLEVLYRYYSIVRNSLRTDSDKRKYKNIVNKILNYS